MSSALVPTWAWALLAALLLVCVVVDLAAHRGDHVDSRRRALLWSLGWIGVSIGFGGFVTLRFGDEAGEQWFAAYLLEKSLSIDNLFLFVVVFGSLAIPRTEQRRVLTWGIFGALFTRMLFIITGAAALERWRWITYVFGALLVVTAVKLARAPAGAHAEKPRSLTWISRWLPSTPHLHGHHFFARIDGRRVATPLLVALIAIELADIMFALDSIPAAFAVSEDRFILYSSNLFAILGLRALYLVLEDALQKLRYLKVGLVGVLGFAGAKLLVAPWLHVPPIASVSAIVAVIVAVVVASLGANARDRSRSRSAREVPRAGHRDPRDPLHVP